MKLSREIESMIRVNHAGEFGAVIIYQTQICFSKNKFEMLYEHLESERIHLNLFNALCKKYKIRRSLFLPVWYIGGIFLGALTAIIGKNAMFSTTKAVEKVVISHYKKQIKRLEELQLSDLSHLFKKCLDDEIKHESEVGSEMPMFEKVVSKLCVAAIVISSKI